jgi:prepilin-type N-terminal cleavage/methylation domain-containing protein
VKTRLSRRSTGQDGYTLVELIIAVAIGALLMSALTSVVLTTWRGTSTATSRVEASSQIRNFQYFAYDDFAAGGVPSISCGPAPPCTILVTGTRVNNSTAPVPAPSAITYNWDGANLDRQIGSSQPIHAATNVTAFTAYVDSSGAFPIVVVSMTVTVQAYGESQTFRFYPRINA